MAADLQQPSIVRLSEVPMERKQITGGVHQIVAEYLAPLFSGVDREQSAVVSLDAHWNVIGVDVIGVGGATQVMMGPREAFRAAIRRGAAQVVVAHSHPMGSTEPSEPDRMNTATIVKAGFVLDIPVADAVVVGHDGTWVSMLTGAGTWQGKHTWRAERPVVYERALEDLLARL